MADTPQASAIFAISVACSSPSLNPFLILIVMGLMLSLTIFVKISSTSFGWVNKYEPSWLLTILGTGQPMLISIKSQAP